VLFGNDDAAAEKGRAAIAKSLPRLPLMLQGLL
jgi:hypothetical protein